MARKIKLFLASLGVMMGIASLVVNPAAVVAQSNPSGSAKSDICKGINNAGGGCNERGEGLSDVLKLVVQIISVIAGVAAVIMIIIGGLRYITSGGDSSKVASAKSAIIYAIIGLVIVALAQIIVRYVADATTEA